MLGRFDMITGKLKKTADFFSIKLLLGTIFAPYKQISAETDAISFNDKIKAFFDKLLSRLIGAVVRLSMIGLGMLAMFFLSIWEGVKLLIWLVLPLIPLAGLVIWVIGWMP